MKQFSKFCIALALVFAASNVHAFPGKKARLLGLAACVLSSGSQAASNQSESPCDPLPLPQLNHSCSEGMIPLPIDCENCDFERGNLDGWAYNGNAGASNNYKGIRAQSGDYFGYVDAGEKDVWKYLKHRFEHLPLGTTVSGFVGFYDAEENPSLDQAELVDKYTADFEPQESIIKSWTTVEKPKVAFRGWEHFEFRVRGDREVEFRVKNVANSFVNSSFVIDNLSLCAPVCTDAGQPGEWQVCECEIHGPCNNTCYDWNNVTSKISSRNYLSTNYFESHLGECRD